MSYQNIFIACLLNSKCLVSLWMEEQRESHHNSSAYNMSIIILSNYQVYTVLSYLIIKNQQYNNVIISKCNISMKISGNRHMKSLSNIIKYSKACLLFSKPRLSMEINLMTKTAY